MSNGTASTRVVWRPQPRQLAFMQRPEDEVLYGGAAGGGKSEALVIEALRQVHIPHYRGIILRRTVPDLKELLDKSHKYYRAAYPGARCNATTHTWIFPSGAKIYFGSMQREADREDYRGLAFDFIGFDELTLFTQPMYDFMVSRNRASGPGTRCYMRATTNPGGVGHGWVKERFITAAPPMTTIETPTYIDFPDGHRERRVRTRIFVPARIFDNQKLLDNDPDYLTNLASMPDAERKAFLYGDWDSFSGQVFTEWRNDPTHYEDRLRTHVISPFAVPRDWSVWRGMDWGMSRPFAVQWYAVEPGTERLYMIRELYGCQGDSAGRAIPNRGVGWEPEQLAAKIAEIERMDPQLRGRRIHGVADPAITQRQTGESVAAMMERQGVYWDKADNTRIAGKMQLHNRLAFRADGRPMLQVFTTCRHFIRTLPDLVYSQTDVEDVDTDCEDHAYDACRYVLMEHPCPAPVAETTINDLYGEDPLNLRPYNHRAKYREY